MEPIRQHAIAGLIGFACAYLLFLVFAPERWLPEDKLVLLVAEWCPKSLELQRQVDGDQDLNRQILVLPIDEGIGEDSTRSRCEFVVQGVFESAPWLRLEDEAWVCHRVRGHSTALFRKHFVGLPAWLENGAPVARGKEREALERHGITLCPGPYVYADGTSCSNDLPSKPNPVEILTVERGRDIGF